MGIIGLAEWYSKETDMRKSVFISRAASAFSVIQSACAERGVYIDAPKYDKFWGLRKDDKFGLKLWDALSYGTFDFSHEVPKDRDLSDEWGCDASACLSKARVISGVFRACCVREADYLDGIGETLSLPRNLGQAYLRGAYAEIGEVIGVKDNLVLMSEGALMSDLFSPDEMYYHMPSAVSALARKQLV